MGRIPVTQTDPRRRGNVRLRHRKRVPSVPVTQTDPILSRVVRSRHRKRALLTNGASPTRRRAAQRRRSFASRGVTHEHSGDAIGSLFAAERAFVSLEPGRDPVR